MQKQCIYVCVNMYKIFIAKLAPNVNTLMQINFYSNILCTMEKWRVWGVRVTKTRIETSWCLVNV
jgi:hypothetical protein